MACEKEETQTMVSETVVKSRPATAVWSLHSKVRHLAFAPTMFPLFLFAGILTLEYVWNEWQRRYMHTRFIPNCKRRLYGTATVQVKMKRCTIEAATC